MLSGPVVAPHRVEMLRHLLLALAAAAGMAASGYVLSSQAAADFLREGAVRFTGLEGETLRLVLELGVLAATGIAAGALWHQVTHPRLLLAAIALGGGMFLAHAVLMPMAVLLVIAAGQDFSQHVTRERFEWARRNSAVLGGGLVGAGAPAASVWLSIWLLGPLFDERTKLDEMLDFEVAGLVEPAAVEPDGTEEGEPVTAVPTTSSVMVESKPSRPPARMPPTRPATGPDIRRVTGLATAWRSLVTPPSDCMSRNSPPTPSCSRPRRSCAMYREACGPVEELSAVVENPSYSRYIGAISWLTETKVSGSSSRTFSAARRSCAGLRNEKRKHTETASTASRAS